MISIKEGETMKTLLFEGAGMETAEHNGVGNIRIRTRLQNKAGRVIYLEMVGCKRHKDSVYKTFAFACHISHCFDQVDVQSNYTPDLSKYQGPRGKYVKKDILAFVNKELGCDFDHIEVVNDNSVRVHDTEQPLSSCKTEA